MCEVVDCAAALDAGEVLARIRKRALVRDFIFKGITDANVPLVIKILDEFKDRVQVLRIYGELGEAACLKLADAIARLEPLETIHPYVPGLLPALRVPLRARRLRYLNCEPATEPDLAALAAIRARHTYLHSTVPLRELWELYPRSPLFCETERVSVSLDAAAPEPLAESLARMEALVGLELTATAECPSAFLRALRARQVAVRELFLLFPECTKELAPELEALPLRALWLDSVEPPPAAALATFLAAAVSPDLQALSLNVDLTPGARDVAELGHFLSTLRISTLRVEADSCCANELIDLLSGVAVSSSVRRLVLGRIEMETGEYEFLLQLLPHYIPHALEEFRLYDASEWDGRAYLPQDTRTHARLWDAIARSRFLREMHLLNVAVFMLGERVRAGMPFPW